MKEDIEVIRKRDKLLKDIVNASKALEEDTHKGNDTDNLKGYLKYLVEQL